MNAATLKKAITDRYPARILKTCDSKWLMSELMRLAELQELPHSVFTACYGIQWSVQTGRMSGTIAIRIRDLNAAGTFGLVSYVAENCPTIGDVPSCLIKLLGEE